MAKLSVFFLLFSYFLLRNITFAVKATRKAHIVYLGAHVHAKDEITSLVTEKVKSAHLRMLYSIMKSKKKSQNAIIQSYTNVINGFAAYLDEKEAAKMSRYPGVISVFPSRGYALHTTHSWGFMGLESSSGKVDENSLWTKARYGEDIVIGNLDGGVWPESDSFNDVGLGPIPSKWKGGCMDDLDQGPFPCNQKLIGAKYFNKGYETAVGHPLNSTFMTPRDTDGHGTHTLSTAGGSFIPNASVFGYGSGTSKGGSPKARVASYKVCGPPAPNGDECFDTDIMAAFDAAIHDGVDVLSLSLGSSPTDYLSDGLAIGSFHAVSNGIAVVCSAGNSGPASGTVSNTAPWIFTVGASTMDRKFPSYLSFDNKQHIKGQSLSTSSLGQEKYYPLVNSRDIAAANSTKDRAELCRARSLDPTKTKGKIVVCLVGYNWGIEKGLAVHRAGGEGMVLVNDITSGDEIIAELHLLPATHVSYSDGLELYAYLNSTESAYGCITKPKTDLGTKPAPVMISFSSRGPNIVSPEILKPDITAPGVSIVAAWPTTVAPSRLVIDSRRSSFNIISGTSMSCPHVAGVVGLLKTLHPDWSPAAIKSAIMTTAHVMDNSGNAITRSLGTTGTPFDYGSGHVWPNSAMDPGLVYDTTPNDYLNFLCALNYDAFKIKNLTSAPFTCPSTSTSIENLNYPSFSILNLLGSMTVTRMVKNVGGPSTYKARVVQPDGVNITVHPDILEFGDSGEEKEYKVTFIAENGPTKYVFGALIWDDGKHVVRSPMVIKGKGY